ncbi:MAG: glycosyl hydrolase, partial [Planctomycetota bacterium]
DFGDRQIVQMQPVLAAIVTHVQTAVVSKDDSMWIDPENTDRVIFGNDGGLYMSYDRCENWLHLNNLPIAEVYAATYDMEQPFNIYIGTQDNAALFGPNTHRPEDGSLDEWTQIYIDQWGGGDAYFTYRDPNDSDTIYYESQYGGLRRQSVSADRSQSIRPQQPSNEPLRFAWMTPYFPSRYESKHLYVGAQYIFKSDNRGDAWRVISPDLTTGPDSPNLLYRSVTALAESPHAEGTLLAGTDNGNLWLTRDDGENWKQIDSKLPDLQASRIEFSPHDPQRFYVTMTGMRYDNFKPFVFRSDDGGTSWQEISVGLPLEPVHVVREDPKVEDLLYVGTDLGVYISSDGGESWNSLCNNLPTVAVHDLFVHPRDNTLVAGTHGLGVFVMDAGEVQKFAE